MPDLTPICVLPIPATETYTREACSISSARIHKHGVSGLGGNGYQVVLSRELGFHLNQYLDLVYLRGLLENFLQALFSPCPLCAMLFKSRIYATQAWSIFLFLGKQKVSSNVSVTATCYIDVAHLCKFSSANLRSSPMRDLPLTGTSKIYFRWLS